MLKPSDITVPSTSDLSLDDIDQLSHLEAAFDSAIKRASEESKWPAVVGHLRDGARPELVEMTCAKYRAAGWTVWSDRGARARISHPDAGR